LTFIWESDARDTWHPDGAAGALIGRRGTVMLPETVAVPGTASMPVRDAEKLRVTVPV
jgi:hypothetical protein